MADQPNADQLRSMVKKGQALAAPGQSRPGRFYITNEKELDDAIRAVGRAGGGDSGHNMVRRFIIKRAKALGLTRMIPDNWNPDGSLKSTS